jgi:outer membrane protein/adhesin transport system outer membrane protein
VPALPRALLPGSEEEARQLALANNPTLAQARFTLESSKHDIALVEGEKMPTVNLQADAIKSHEPPGSRGFERDTIDLLLTFSVPIYQAGQPDARAREAKQVQGQRRTQVDVSQRQIADDATRAWQQFMTAGAQIQSFQAQIRSNEIALEGVSQEARVGSRTVLDVLNAAMATAGLALLCFALSERWWLSAPLVVLVGFGVLATTLPVQLIMQTLVDDDKRGRVMSLSTMLFMGVGPIGNLFAVSLAQAIGPRLALALNGAACALAAVWLFTVRRRMRVAMRPTVERMGIGSP